MAMMARMRSLAPAFILTVGGLFVLFMVISDSNVLEALGGGRQQNVGKVNGEPITYQEFQQAVDQQIENQKRQSAQDLDENQIEQIRSQVWDALLTQKILAGLIKQYKISVSDQEIRDVILGENPPEFLTRNFIDSAGNFNRQLYEDALFDPRNKEALVQAEELVRQSRLTQKLQSLILASVTVGEDEVKKRYLEQNTNIEAEYALFDLSLVPDSVITVTDTDLREYYEKNLSNYKVLAQRKLKFVMFKNVPSSEDSQLVFKNLVNVKNSISAGDTLSFEQLAKIYSETPYSKDSISVQALTSEIIKAFNNASPGSVLGPFDSQEGYVLYKYYGSFPSKEVVARASHILINQYGSDDKNLEEANKLYEKLIAGGNFTMLARDFSQDPGSAQKGGDLGYFTKGMMVKEFEDACFNGKVGEIQKPVKTNYGYHIIKVTDRTDKKFIVEKIVNKIKQSASSRERNYNLASDFSYLAKKNDFESEAKLMNYMVQETPEFTEQTFSIPTLGTNERLVKFAFENKLNTVSDPYKVSDGYVVAKISEVSGEKFRAFDEVKNQIKPIVTREKKFEKIRAIAEDVHKKINNDLGKISQIKPQITVQQTGNFTAAGTIPNIGRDYAFMDAAMKVELNKVSQPIKGQRGYYLIKVLKRTPFDKNAYEQSSAAIRNIMFQEKRNRFLDKWIADLKKNATIEDNRNLFYRD